MSWHLLKHRDNVTFHFSPVPSLPADSIETDFIHIELRVRVTSELESGATAAV